MGTLITLSSKGSKLFTSLLDWKWPWGSQSRIYSKRLRAALITNTWQCSRVLPALRQVGEPLLDPSPTAKTRLLSLIGCNPG